MSAETDKLPPVPQLVAPLTQTKPGVIDLRALRFEPSWLQWFIQLKIKVDTLNASLVSLGVLNTTGGLFFDPANGYVTREIVGTPDIGS